MNKDCFAFEGPLLIPILSDFQSDVRRGVPLYSYNVNRLVQFSSVQSFERLGHWGDIRNDSTQIISQSFLQEALSSSSHMGGDVHSSFCPSGISSADCGVAQPPMCPEGWFWKGYVACDKLIDHWISIFDTYQVYRPVHRQGSILFPQQSTLWQNGPLTTIALCSPSF